MIEEGPIEDKRMQEEAIESSPTDKKLPPAAQRALAEAAERRAAEKRREEAAKTKCRELGGRNGLEPTRYGDWEKGGIVSDF